MRISQHPKPSLKTIKIDAEIFTQETPTAKSKLPLQLLKSLAEKKKNKHWSSLGERYKNGLTRNRMVSNEEEAEDTHSSKAIELLAMHKYGGKREGRGRALNYTDCNFFPHSDF